MANVEDHDLASSPANDSAATPPALFIPVAKTQDAETLLATELTSGPWRPDAQHGGPPSALLGRSLETLVGPDQFLARVSIELVKGVPLVELTMTTTTTRVSGRVWRANTFMHDGDTLVARANGLILSKGEVPEPAWRPVATDLTVPPTGDRSVPSWSRGAAGLSYHRDAVEHRFESGSFETPGEATDWVRLRYPLVAGEETSPLCRVLAAADFGSGISAVYDYEQFGMINADIDVSVWRPLVGEWIRLRSVSHVGHQGTGLGVTELSDTSGQFGVATQALLGYGSSRPTNVT